MSAVIKTRTAMGSLVFGCLLLLLLGGHYLLSPNTDFTGDDWSYLQRSTEVDAGEFFIKGLRDIYRPFNLIANMLFFHYAGDRLVFYSAFAIGAHILLLWLLLGLLRHFLKQPVAVFAAGLFYVLNPNIYESFHWKCHGLLLYVPVLFLLSFNLWLVWCKRGGWWRYALSLACFFIATFSYEHGVPFSLMYVVAAWLPSRQRKQTMAGFAYVAIALLYTAWRFSGGFGMGEQLLTGGEYFESTGFSILMPLQNLRTIASWWVGGLMGQSFLGGFNGFATLLPKVQFGLVVLMLLAVWGTCHVWKKCTGLSAGQDEPVIRWTPFLIGLAWVVLTYSPHLIFPASARHNLLPSFGMALLVGACYEQWGMRRPIIRAWIMPLVFICLLANMGNTLACRDSGIFSRRLYQAVQAIRAEWEDKQVVVFDTQSLRERQTRGILSPRDNQDDTWAEYQNALLLRGFVCSSMVKLAAPQSPVQAILDVECDAVVRNEQLTWHARYNPGIIYSTPLQEVYFIDCLAVASNGTGHESEIP